MYRVKEEQVDDQINSVQPVFGVKCWPLKIRNETIIYIEKKVCNEKIS